MYQQQFYQPYQGQQQFQNVGQYPMGRSGFGGVRQSSYQQMPYYQQQTYHPQQFAYQPQQPKQSFFRNEQGQIDFQKIGGGVQTAMGFINQVSPVMKMIGGFFK